MSYTHTLKKNLKIKKHILKEDASKNNTWALDTLIRNRALKGKTSKFANQRGTKVRP